MSVDIILTITTKSGLYASCIGVQGAARGSERRPLLSPTATSINVDYDDNEEAEASGPTPLKRAIHFKEPVSKGLIITIDT